MTTTTVESAVSLFGERAKGKLANSSLIILCANCQTLKRNNIKAINPLGFGNNLAAS